MLSDIGIPSYFLHKRALMHGRVGRGHSNRCQSLLTATKLLVLEIVSRLGYSSLSHFTRLFREYSGMPPSRYRMRWEEKHSVAD